MKKKKTPPERKADEYANEVRYEAWHSAHGDRRNRPLRKAIENRARRREVQQVLPSSPTTVDEEQADDLTTEAQPIRHDSIRFSSTAVPLAEHIRRNEDRRLRSVGSKYLRKKYDSDLHRKPFGRFLENITSGGTADPVALAELFAYLLASSASDAALSRKVRDRITDSLGGHAFPEVLDLLCARFPSLFLQAFLVDEPRWRNTLERWIEETLTSRS